MSEQLHCIVTIDGNRDRAEMQLAALLAELRRLYPLDDPHAKILTSNNDSTEEI